TKFLKIGRNRRQKLNSQVSESGKRHVIGKKGIGKLSFFGIAHSVEVETIRDSKRNAFRLDWQELKSSNENYEPEIIVKDEPTLKPVGTKITLTQITRKTSFDPDNIAYNLAKTFSVFDESDFQTFIVHNGDVHNKIEVKNDLRHKNLEPEFEWIFPLPSETIKMDYEYANRVTGKIISNTNTVPSNINGITL